MDRNTLHHAAQLRQLNGFRCRRVEFWSIFRGTGRNVTFGCHKWLRRLEGEARLIAMRLGQPPKGCGQWTLQLLADQLVQLEVVDSICPETVRQTLKTIA